MRIFSTKTSLISAFLISCLLIASSLMGFESGLRTQAYLAFTQRNYDEAMELYDDIDDFSGQGMVLLAQNYPDEAWTYFSRVEDKSGMGLTHLKKREYENALEYFETKSDYRGMGLAYLGMRDEDNAYESFAKANDWSGLGLLALAKKDYREAKRCFNYVEDHSGLGLTALKEKKFTQAFEYFEKAKDVSGKGLCCLAMRDFKRAIAFFEEVNDWSGLGHAYLAQGNYEKAEYYFKKAHDKNGLGDMYSKLYQFDKARKMFADDYNPVKVIQSYRNDFNLKDRHEQAIAYGKEALHEGRMIPEILMEMADVYYEMKQAAEAIASLDKALEYQGYESEAHLRKGRIYFYLREFEIAKAEFLQVKADDFAQEHHYKEAQASLKTIDQYLQMPREQLQRLTAAPSF